MLDYLEEATKLFKELTPENQANLLMCTRIAYMSECSVKKSLASIKDISSSEAMDDKAE